MIAKHIEPKDNRQGVKNHHDFRKLGNYCRDASHAGEKCLLSWHEGCLAPDYDLALVEITATQAMNTRCRNDKTYHLMISFRPEDEAKLNPEAYRKIELAMADALGVSGHQRVCGVHKNTNNLHMHVAYNLIHPEKYTIHEPFRDFYKLAESCREMEKEFDLAIDNGITLGEPKRENKVDQRAASMEAHSGEQSFQAFVFDRKNQIVNEVIKATTWEEAHRVFADYGIEIKEQGNGLALVNLQGQGKKKEGMKASALDRSLSKSKLVARFGHYIPPVRPSEAKEPYEKKALQPRSQERDQLYKDYRAAITEKIARIDGEKARGQAEVAVIYEQWAMAKDILKKGTSSPKALSSRLNIIRGEWTVALSQAKLEHRERLAAIKKEYPWYNWNGYLKHQAALGNKAALAALRSRPESPQQQNGPDWDGYLLEQERARLSTARREKVTLRASHGSGLRQTVTAINRMSLLAEQERLRIKAGIENFPMFAGYRQTIDNRGVVIFTLDHGGTIRDAGRKLYFSPDEITTKAARLYALAKFGRNLNVQGNIIEREQSHGRKQCPQPHPGILRECARHGLRTLSKLSVVFDRKRTEVLLPYNAHADLER